MPIAKLFTIIKLYLIGYFSIFLAHDDQTPQRLNKIRKMCLLCVNKFGNKTMLRSQLA